MKTRLLNLQESRGGPVTSGAREFGVFGAAPG